MKNSRVIAVLSSIAVCCGCVSEEPLRYTDRGVQQDNAPAAVQAPVVIPRVMILVDEKSLGTIPTAEVEGMAIAMIRKAKGQIVDQDMVRSNIKKDQSLLKSVGDNRGAAAIGLQYGADVMIVGEAVAKPSARRIAESNLRTYEAVATLRAVRTDTSETIASASESASIPALDDVSGSSKALKAAARTALETLIPEMTAEWQNVAKRETKTGSSVAITVGGVDQLWKVKNLREHLKGMSGVKNVVQRDYTSGAAIFEIESSLPTEELSEKLVLSPPEGLKLQVLSVSKAKMELRAVAAQN